MNTLCEQLYFAAPDGFLTPCFQALRGFAEASGIFANPSWVNPFFFRVATIGTTVVRLEKLRSFIWDTDNRSSSQKFCISRSEEYRRSIVLGINRSLKNYKAPETVTVSSTRLGRETRKPFSSTLISAWRRSYAVCISNKRRASTPKVFCKRSARSADTPIFPWISLETVDGETFIAVAKAVGLIFRVVITSSTINPGWHGFNLVIRGNPCNQL